MHSDAVLSTDQEYYGRHRAEYDPKTDVDFIIAEQLFHELQAGNHILEGATVRRLHAPADTESYKDFDDHHFFDRYDSGVIPNDHRPAVLTEEMIDSAMRDGYVQGVFDGDKLIGTLWLEADEEKKDLHVTNVCVSEDMRGQGIGKYFMATAAAIARNRGMNSLSLDVDPLNIIAMGLYLDLGYTIDNYKRDDDEDVIKFGLQGFVGMVKKLNGRPISFSTFTRSTTAGQSDVVEDLLARGYVGVGTVGQRNTGEEASKNGLLFARPRSRFAIAVLRILGNDI